MSKPIIRQLLMSLMFIVLGLCLGYYLTPMMNRTDTPLTGSITDNATALEPLYWVAPMDANYRRDKPGKSPMGMDLVPVYAETMPSNSGQQQASDESLSKTVSIRGQMTQNIGVRTQPMHQARFSQRIRAYGQVVVDPYRSQRISVRVSGWLTRLFVRANGVDVTQGEPLYTVYSPALVHAQEEYVLALARGVETLEIAAKARLQALGLTNAQILTLGESKQVQTAVTVYAPQSGIVRELMVREGDYVQPASALMTLADLDEVWVDAQAPLHEASRLHVGDSVMVNQQHVASITHIYPDIDVSAQSVRFRLALANPQKAKQRPWKLGEWLNLQIKTSSETAHWLVPQSAIIRTQGSTRIVISSNHHSVSAQADEQQTTYQFRSVPVRVSHWRVHPERDANTPEDNTYWAVIHPQRVPFSEHDRVVVSAQFLIDSESYQGSAFARLMSAPDDASSGASEHSMHQHHRMHKEQDND